VAEPSSLKRLSQEKKETPLNNKVLDHPAAFSSETCPTLLLKTTLENSSKVLVKSRPSDLLLTVMVAQRVSLTLISKLKNKPKRPSKNPELNSMEEPSELTSLMPVAPDPEAEVASEEEVDSVEAEVVSVEAEAVTQVASVKEDSVKVVTEKVETVKVATEKVATVKVVTEKVETVKVATEKVATVKVATEKVETVKVDSALKVDSEEEAVEVPPEVAALPPEEADKDPRLVLIRQDSRNRVKDIDRKN